MAIYETERKATLFQKDVRDDPITFVLREKGVAVRVEPRSTVLSQLEDDLAADKIDPSRQAFAERLADELSAALVRDGDVVAVYVDGPKALYDFMWDYLNDLNTIAKRIDKRAGSSEISHGAVPERGCALTRVFSFPH